MSSSVGRNSLIMASGTAASRVTGQIRTILLAWALGTTGYAANAYQAGSMIPQVIYTLVSGGIFNAVLVPQIVRTLKAKDAETKLNKLITLAITMLLAVTILMALCTPLLTKLYVNGSPETMALATSFTLWCMPQIFFYGLYTVVGQILAAKDHFTAYAWSSVGANIISCIGFGTFIALFGRATEHPLDFWTADKIALTAGTWTLGVAFQALVLFIPLTKIGLKYRPTFGLRGIGLRSMGPVAAWSVGIVVIDQLANIVITRTSTNAPMLAQQQFGINPLDVAGNASYQNAYTIYMLPYSLIAVSLATAIFPKISRAVADHNIAEARIDLSQALRNMDVLFRGRFRGDACSDHSRVAAVCERQRGDSYGGTVGHAWRGTSVRQRVSDYPAHVLCIRRRQIAVHFHAVRHGHSSGKRGHRRETTPPYRMDDNDRHGRSHELHTADPHPVCHAAQTIRKQYRRSAHNHLVSEIDWRGSSYHVHRRDGT